MMMDSNAKPQNNFSPSPLKFYKLLGFVGIIREAPNLLLKYGKLMSSITILMIFLSSMLLLMNIISTTPSVTDLFFKASFLTVTDSTSPEVTDLITCLKVDLQLVMGLEGIFILAFSFTSIFFAASLVLASGVTFCGKNISVKELLSLVKLFKRPFVTWFYIMLLHLGYSVFLIAFLVHLVVLSSPKFTLPSFSILVLMVSVLFQAYLVVVWNLALNVSVLEEKWGIDALGKTGQLIRRSKLRGFCLNILSGAFSVAVVYGLKKIGNTAFSGCEIVIPLLLLNSLSLIRMISLTAYTIVGYECKETHGEELEMEGVKYTKVTAFTPLISSDEVC